MKSGGDARFKVDANLKVVIGYEDFDSGMRAMNVYRRTLEAAAGPCEVRIWKFEPLGIPELFQAASKDLARSDIVIISIAGDRPLPLEAVEWVALLGKERAGRDGALLLVTAPKHQGGPAALLASAFLERIAGKAKRKYFAPPGCLRNASEMGESAGFSSACVEEAVLHAARYDHWGLNE